MKDFFCLCKLFIQKGDLIVSARKHLFVLVTTAININIFYVQFVFSAQPVPQAPLAQAQEETLDQAFNRAEERLRQLIHTSNAATRRIGYIDEVSTETLERVNRINAALDGSDQAVAALAQERRAQRLEDKIQAERAKIDEKERRGIYVAPEKEKWENIRKILTDSKLLIKIAAVIIVLVLCYYIIKYGLPVLINYLTRPRVISETSRTGWFGCGKSEPTVNINDLIFSPCLQKQLSDLLSRIQTAKIYGENLPNLLFSGASGTGKTAFAKALAYNSGLDYALTSGSEFAKITDLGTANDELRNLLNWAQNSSNGLLVFIDEAESMFANKKFSTTPKATQDLINTFLALVSDQSQKNVMFILSTNHSFKLDDAVANRMGINIEFTLPEEPEREKILNQYLIKFAQENNEFVVDIHPEIIQKLPMYAKSLEGFSPRAIKFVAEDMIIKARRQGARLLTDAIAQLSLSEAKRSLEQDQQREEEREKWLRTLPAN